MDILSGRYEYLWQPQGIQKRKRLSLKTLLILPIQQALFPYLPCTFS